ncbi:MAG: tRNA uridine-5-carboxymethylaminomethyl(34) synthesis enzyme MnmG, partial [Alphaproteobacteria bacterium]|nr:tRNA uridine-5-carboxymethylaminomethyl(34) synthesis enzyme MnmG [Alphaproteobacteria bacterium]
IAAGLVGSARERAFSAKMAALEAARAEMRALTLTPNQAQKLGLTVRLDGVRRNGFELLALPGVEWPMLQAIWPELGGLSAPIVEQLEIDARYSGYLDRQEADIAAFRRDEGLHLPSDLDYRAVHGLSTEAAQKLGRIRPTTLGQAARIDGVTPAALTLVLAHVRGNARHGIRARKHEAA